MSREQILQAVLALAPDERAALAAEIYESLEEEDEERVEGAAWEAAWAAEVERRLEEVARGTARTVPAEEVFRAAGLSFRSR